MSSQATKWLHRGQHLQGWRSNPSLLSGNIQHIILAWCELCIFTYKWLPSAAILLNFFEKPCKLSTNSSNWSTKLPTSSNSHPSYQQSGLGPEVQGRFCWQLRPNPTCSRRVLHPNATPEAWLASPSNMHGCMAVLMKAKPSHSRFTHQCNPLCESFFIIIIDINI